MFGIFNNMINNASRVATQSFVVEFLSALENPHVQRRLANSISDIFEIMHSLSDTRMHEIERKEEE